MLMGMIMLLLGTACALGYSAWSAVQPLGMSILDFFDFLTNSILMPIAALSTCLLIIKKAGVGSVVDEIRSSSRFKSQRTYTFFIRYLSPIILLVILLSSIAAAMGLLQI